MINEVSSARRLDGCGECWNTKLLTTSADRELAEGMKEGNFANHRDCRRGGADIFLQLLASQDVKAQK